METWSFRYTYTCVMLSYAHDMIHWFLLLNQVSSNDDSPCIVRIKHHTQEIPIREGGIYILLTGLILN